MNVSCLFKWVRNPDDARVGADGSVTWRREKFWASDDDAAAIEFARRLAETTGGELAGVTVGDGDASWALARGAQRVVSVADVGPSPDDAAMAAALAAAVRRAGEADVVVMGDAQEHAGVVGALGALLGMPVLAGVDEVAADAEGAGRVLVRRRVGTDVETVVATTPVLVAVAARSAEKNVPGVRQMLEARKRPVDTISAAEVGITGADAVTVVRSRVPEVHSARIFAGDLVHATRELVAALRGDGTL